MNFPFFSVLFSPSQEEYYKVCDPKCWVHTICLTFMSDNGQWPCRGENAEGELGKRGLGKVEPTE